MSVTLTGYNLAYYRELLLKKEKLSTSHLYEHYFHSQMRKQYHLTLNDIACQCFSPYLSENESLENVFLKMVKQLKISTLLEIIELSNYYKEMELAGYLAFILWILKQDKTDHSLIEQQLLLFKYYLEE